MAPYTPNLRELRAFHTVHRTGSVSDAARLMNVSQPAISKALRHLETSLQISLFERIAGRLHATPEADLLLPTTENVFAAISTLAAAGQAIRDGQLGQVTVGALPTLAHVFLPSVIGSVAERHPKMRVSMHILSTRQIVDGVTRRLFDLGFVHDLIDEPSLSSEDLAPSAMCAVVPSGHTLQGRKHVRPRDLRDLPFVSFPVQSPIGMRLGSAFARAGETFAPAIEVDSSTALCATAETCRIVGVVERHVFSLGYWSGLEAIPLSPPILLRPRVFSNPHRPLSSAARLFLEEYRRVVAKTLSRRTGLAHQG